MDDVKRIRVITVHGTFDPGALWDNPDSVLVQGLTERLGDAGAALDLYNYEWSGENSHEARREAAEGLADLMTDDLESRRFRDVFVIGHSHGGTVARLAANLMRSDRRPTGVFTFGSPFLRFRPRSVRISMLVLQWLIVALGLAGSLALGLQLAESFGPDAATDASFFSGPIGLTLAIIAALAAMVALAGLVRRARTYLLEKREFLTSRYDPPERLPVGYVCYHAVGDEAGILLRFWSLITWLMQTMIFVLLYGAMAMVTMMLALVGIRVLAEFGFDLWPILFDGPVTAAIDLLAYLDLSDASAAALDDEAQQYLFRSLPGMLALNIVVALLGILVLALAVAPLALTIPWLLRAQNFAFGGEELSWCFATDINVDRLPNKRSRLKLRMLPQAYFNQSIQHNYYYMDAKVIDDIAARILRWDVVDRRFAVDLEEIVSKTTRIGLLLTIIAAVFVSAVALALI